MSEKLKPPTKLSKKARKQERFVANGIMSVEVRGKTFTIPRFGVIFGNEIVTDPQSGHGKHSLPNHHAALIEAQAHTKGVALNISKRGKARYFRSKPR